MDQNLTVSSMVTLLAKEASGDEAVLSRIARSLINVGLLPKASGRAVPTVSFEHRARFLLACMATDRPSDAPQMMLERFAATEVRTSDPKTAGEFLIEHLGYLAEMNQSAWSRWSYSRLDVSRKVPSVTARLNENLAGFSDVTLKQHNFVNTDAILAGSRENGIAVTASIPGSALAALAIGGSSLHASLRFQDTD